MPGAPSALHACKMMLHHGGTPTLWFKEWCRDKNIARQSRLWHEVKCLIDAIERAGTYDQLNLGASVAVETLIRRLLAIVEAMGKDAENPDWSLAGDITGEANISDLMSVELRGEVSRTAKDRIDRESFKARAKTALANKTSLDDAVGSVGTGGLPAANGGIKPGKGDRRGRGRGAQPASGAQQ